jgi:hypothetical protein
VGATRNLAIEAIEGYVFIRVIVLEERSNLLHSLDIVFRVKSLIPLCKVNSYLKPNFAATKDIVKKGYLFLNFYLINKYLHAFIHCSNLKFVIDSVVEHPFIACLGSSNSRFETVCFMLEELENYIRCFVVVSKCFGVNVDHFPLEDTIYNFGKLTFVYRTVLPRVIVVALWRLPNCEEIGMICFEI